MQVAVFVFTYTRHDFVVHRVILIDLSRILQKCTILDHLLDLLHGGDALSLAAQQVVLDADPHVQARGDVVMVDDPDAGPIRMVAPLARLSATPAEIRWAGPGLGAHTDEVLHEVTVALHTVQSSLSVGACRVARRWDARQVWAVGGYKSAVSRLSADAMVSKATAGRVLHRARVLSSMPATAEAVSQGVLSGDHLDLFAHANTPARRDLFAEHEQTLVGECARLRWHEAVRAVRYWCARADALLDSGSASPNPVPEVDEHLHASPTLDDTVVLNGVLGAVSGEIVLNELDRLADLVYLADQKAGIERTGSQRRAQGTFFLSGNRIQATNEIINVEVFDLNGTRIMSLRGTGRSFLDVSNLKPGLYTLRVQTSVGLAQAVYAKM